MLLPQSSKQLNLSSEIIIGSGHVRILTGRTEPSGRPEVLVGAFGKTDLEAIRNLDNYCAQVQKDRKKK